MTTYYYQFLEPISKELAETLQELEGAIYTSPRTMLTHSRTLIEAVMGKALVHENISCPPYVSIIERIQRLDEKGLLTPDVRNALHDIRKLGNIAAHDTRQFRNSESLITWERIYTVMKWYVEVYGPYEVIVPDYVDPAMKVAGAYDLEEMQIRLNRLEAGLKESINQQATEPATNPEPAQTSAISEKQTVENNQPGHTTIRTITCKEKVVHIPYFLRDSFLLPQRFEESENYLIRLGAAQQARIMSELPSDLSTLHTKVTRYNEGHTDTFVDELKAFIQEEIRRRTLSQTRPGELFLFYKGEQIIVTEALGKKEINDTNFTGAPSLITQLNEDGIYLVKDLPKELVIIGKYKSIGKMRIRKFFEQLRGMQGE